MSNVRKLQLPAELSTVLEPLLEVLDGINTELEGVEEMLAKLCVTEPIISLLATAPGVGPVVAASFVSVLDEAKRFSSAHHVESYLGLVPTEDSSGGKRRLGAIGKKGNKYVRALLVQSAWAILRSPDRQDPLGGRSCSSAWKTSRSRGIGTPSSRCVVGHVAQRDRLRACSAGHCCQPRADELRTDSAIPSRCAEESGQETVDEEAHRTGGDSHDLKFTHSPNAPRTRHVRAARSVGG